MNTDEMIARWPELPPLEARFVKVDGDGRSFMKTVNQDTIDEIIEYFQAAKDSMNS